MNDCDTLIYLHSSMHTLHESVGGQVQVNETSTITAGQHKYPHLLDIKNISLRILTDLLGIAGTVVSLLEFCMVRMG